MFKGLKERLQHEITARSPSSILTKVISSELDDLNLLPWVGGSTIGSLTIFDTAKITREEYDEHGTAIVHRKCM